jgi:hypothetical protein
MVELLTVEQQIMTAVRLSEIKMQGFRDVGYRAELRSQAKAPIKQNAPVQPV